MESRVHPNRLGIWGWIGGGRWGYERYLYALHRVTGLGLLLYFLLHIFVTSARAFGANAAQAHTAWDAAMKSVEGPVFKAGEFLVFLAFAFHAINGLRLGFIELGFGVGKPIEPVYPYATSVGRQRGLAVAALLIAGALAVWGAWNFRDLFLGRMD